GSYTYTKSQENYIQLKYSGNTIQPIIDQFQPIAVNIDPLNIIVGNTYLETSFQNQFNLIYSNYKILNDRYLAINGTYATIINPITTDVVVDSSGRSTYQFVNMIEKNSTSFRLGSYYGLKIKSIGTIVGLTLNAEGRRYANYINNGINIANSA